LDAEATLTIDTREREREREALGGNEGKEGREDWF
jgi:hypothetical protein